MACRSVLHGGSRASHVCVAAPRDAPVFDGSAAAREGRDDVRTSSVGHGGKFAAAAARS